MVERMLPIKWDLVGEDAIVQGSYWNKPQALTYLDVNGNVVVWDTTGYTARMHVRANIESAVALELSTANGRLVVGEPNTTVRLVLTAGATMNVPDFGMGVYDLVLTDQYGVDQIVFHGRAAMQRRVTR